MTTENTDRLVKALTSLGAVSMLKDSTIPGCQHSGDRIVLHYHVDDGPAWATYRGRFLKSLSNVHPAPKVHMCLQYMWGMTPQGKEGLLGINTLEVEDVAGTVDKVCELFRAAKKGGPIDAKQAEAMITVAGATGRSKSIKSGLLGTSGGIR